MTSPSDVKLDLMPFGSYKTDRADFECPKCQAGFLQSEVPARHCIQHHIKGLPSLDASVQGKQGEEHLHRECPRCKYTWLERTADGMEDGVNV